MAINRLNID